MIFGASSLSILLTVVMVAVFHLFPTRARTRLWVVVIFNFVFLFLSLKAMALVVLLIAVVPYVLLIFRPRALSRYGWLIACVVLVLFAWLKIEKPGAISGPIAFDQVFQTALPIGFSYVMFLSLSLIFDAKRNVGSLEKPSLLSFFAVGLFAPAMPAGPFLQWRQIDDSSFEIPTTSVFLSGMTRIFWGLAKKGIGDFIGLALLKDDSFFASQNSFEGWLMALLVAARFYCDFSGSADLAIGVGRSIGIQLPDNFNLPFLAKSVGEYWRRWHISLGEWFRTYFYLPLLAAVWPQVRRMKSSFSLTAVNALAIFLTMLPIGLWHGINLHFLFWGILVGLLIVISPWLSLRSESRIAMGINIVTTFYLMMWAQLFLTYAMRPGFFEKWISMHTFTQLGRFQINPVYLSGLAFSAIVGPHAVDAILRRYDGKSGLKGQLAWLTFSIFCFLLLGQSGLPFIYSRF